MEQTRPLPRTQTSQALQKSPAQTTQSAVAQEQPARKPALDVSKQPMQTQPVEGQEKTSIWKKWWFWLIIALVVIGVGVGIYLWFSTITTPA